MVELSEVERHRLCVHEQRAVRLLDTSLYVFFHFTLFFAFILRLMNGRHFLKKINFMLPITLKPKLGFFAKKGVFLRSKMYL